MRSSTSIWSNRRLIVMAAATVLLLSACGKATETIA